MRQMLMPVAKPQSHDSQLTDISVRIPAVKMPKKKILVFIILL